jgi:RES domain-containing protein
VPERTELAVPLPTKAAKGFSYRFVKLKYAHDPISGIGSLKAAGRYHIAGSFKALYTSENPVAALHETAFLLTTSLHIHFKPAPPTVLFALEYNLERILDLRDPEVLGHLGVKHGQLFDSWIRNTPMHPSVTQLIARAAYEAGVQGLYAPSAVPPHNTMNVIVYPDNLEAGGSSWVQVSDPEGTYTHRLP